MGFFLCVRRGALTINSLNELNIPDFSYFLFSIMNNENFESEFDPCRKRHTEIHDASSVQEKT